MDEKKLMSLDTYEQRMADFYEFVHVHGDNFSSSWIASAGYKRWVLKGNWLTIVREMPPLIAAGLQYGQPEGRGRWAWSLVNAHTCERMFSDDHDLFVKEMRASMDIDFMKIGFSDAWRYGAMEEYVHAYQHFNEFNTALADYGVTQFKLQFTERGMSVKEVKALEAFLDQCRKDIELFRNPPARKPLFGA